MTTTTTTVKSEQGLGNRALLDKMDKLRELGISNMVPLPQVRPPGAPEYLAKRCLEIILTIP
jgi:hypothetical protein